MYSDSLVLNAIWVCILEDYMIRQTTYIIASAVRNFAVVMSSKYVGLRQFPLKSESA